MNTRGIRYAFSVALGIALALCLPGTGYADPRVTGASLVKEIRISRTVFDYVYRATAENPGDSIRNAEAQLVGVGPGSSIIDGAVRIGDMPDHSVVSPADTFTIRHDRTIPFDRSALRWVFSWERVPAAETILDHVSAPVGPEGAATVLPGTAMVAISEDPFRLPLTLEVQKIRSPDMITTFESTRPEAGPVLGEIIKIHSTERINTPVAVCLTVPGSFIAEIPQGYRVELFAEFIQSSDLEEPYATYEKLGATYDPDRSEACATVPPFAFKPVASVVAHVLIGAYPNVAATTEVVATNFTPVGPVQTSPNATLTVAGELSMTIPPILVSPLSGALNVTSKFGPRVHPVTGAINGFHFGVDLSANHVAVLSAALGNVIQSGAQNPCNTWVNGVCKTGYGHRVTISHQGTTGTSQTRYAHLEPVGLAGTGEIEGGDRVGTADSSGSITGPHLHFEYRPNGNAVDPMLFIGEVDVASYLQSFSVVTKIDGNPIDVSRRQVSAAQFHYGAAIDLTPLALSPGNHTLSVEVENRAGLATVIHTAILEVTQFAMRVKVTWNSFDTDVDLHVRDSSGNESWYANLCGIENGCLDHDDVDGFGPEIFDLSAMDPDRTYTVFLHYYSDHGNGPTTATVTVEIGEDVYGPFSRTISDGEVWTIGTFPQ